MELTYEESEKMIAVRLGEYPELLALVNNATFGKSLSEILTSEHANLGLREQIEFEIKLVLAQYAPVSELGQNLSQSTGLPIESADRIANLIEAVILQPVYDELLAFDALWEMQQKEEASIPVANLESKERLELHPDGERGGRAEETDEVRSGEVAATTPVAKEKDSAAQPLTREELMNALAGKRTMASDIEAVRKSREEAKKE